MRAARSHDQSRAQRVRLRIYRCGLGTVLLVAPNPFLAVFGLPPVGDVWIRALGMAFLFLPTYHVVARRRDFTVFHKASAYLRALVIVFFAAFALLGLVKPILILFGGFDLAGAIWTAIALRSA